MDPVAFAECFEDIVVLSATEGPPTNVFQTKFMALEQMRRLQETLTNIYACAKSLSALQQLCRCLVFIGTTMIEVEEVEEGFVELRKAYHFMRCCVEQRLISDAAAVEPTDTAEILHPIHHFLSKKLCYAGCVEFMRVHNALGICLSSGQLENAKKVLCLAEEAYLEWDSWYSEQQPETCATTSVPVGDDGRLQMNVILEQGGPERLAVVTQRYEMDVAYTSTLFYLSQLYIALGDVPLASKYCHLILYFQLLYKQAFTPKTWATNALQLSGFYSNYFAYGQALHCLQAAQLMMPKEDPDDSTLGAVAWGFGSYHLHRLKHYGSLKHELPANTRPPDTNFQIYWRDFRISGLSPVQAQAPILTVDDARNAFKDGSQALDTALQYHPFETCCTQHIQLLQNKSQLYAALAIFETNQDRIIAIVERQISLTEKIPDQLSFNAYPIVVRQLLYDLGFLYEKLVCLHREQCDKAHKGDGLLKGDCINNLVNKSEEFYQRFCDSWKCPNSRAIPDVLDADSRLPFFRTLLQLAHVGMCRVFATAKEEFVGISKPIEAFRRAIAFAKKNPLEPGKAQEGLEKEMRSAEELLELLLAKQRDLIKAHQLGFLR